MHTRQAPVQEAVREQPETKHRNWTPWLIVVAVLGLIAVGLAIWAFDDEASDPRLETVTELVERLHEGLNERDADKVTSVFTDDGVINDAPVSIAFSDASVLSDFERVSEVTELRELDVGGDYFIFVQQFVNVDSGDFMRAPMLIELDGDLVSQGEWVPDFFFPTD